MAPPPQGLQIGSSAKPWTIGRKLGSGACGSVHELIPPSSKSSSQPYAIKLAVLPKTKSVAGGKKRKKTAQERNADLIFHEFQTLQNLGPDVRGRLVPDIPYLGSPPAYGDIDGFRFLVLDRMSAPLSDVASILLDSHKNSSVSKIPLGDVAAAMLDCIQAMHSKGLVFVDVKSENFMLAPATSSKGSNKSVADRIRLIDFGLVESVNDMSTARHREDVEGSPLVGTPTYASINVMSGHTASRRDDLEALGYVISEIILMLVSKKGKSGGEDLLPWSGAKSDDELLQVKKREMDATKRSKSRLFAALKAAGSDVVMGNYFDSVMGLKYAAAPDYDSLRCYLKKLIVTVQSRGGLEGKKADGKVKAPVRKSSLQRKEHKREASPSDSDDEVEVVEPVSDKKPAAKKPPAKSPKKQKHTAEDATAPRRSARSRTIATQTEPIALDSDYEDDDAEVRNMDWEKTSDENEPPTSAGAAQGKAFLNLEIVEGPHDGTVIPIGGHHKDTIVVGKNPKANSKPSVKDAVGVALPNDNLASSLHAKFNITSKKTVHSIKVTDMSSTNGTFVNGSVLGKGKSRQAFPGDKIKIGDSIFEIKRC